VAVEGHLQYGFRRQRPRPWRGLSPPSVFVRSFPCPCPLSPCFRYPRVRAPSLALWNTPCVSDCVRCNINIRNVPATTATTTSTSPPLFTPTLRTRKVGVWRDEANKRLVVSFRGTAQFEDVLTDVNILLVSNSVSATRPKKYDEKECSLE